MIIGSVGQASGFLGSLMLGQIKGVQVWIARQNALGGVNCHPIKYLVRDDGGDPSRHQAAVQELVEREKIVALLHMIAPITGQASADYITRKGIPAIGDDAAAKWAYKSPMFFPQMSLAEALIEGGFGAVGRVAKAEGKSKLANLACIEVPACTEANDYAPKFTQDNGMTLVYQGRFSLTQPDFTASCQAAKDAGAEIVGIWADGNGVQRVGRSCSRLNYHPIYFGPTQAITDTIRANPDVEGMVFNSTVIPWYRTDNPEVAAHHKAMKDAGAGKADNGSITGWVSARLFEEATRNLSDPPTSQSILEGLWSIKDNDLGGLTYPLTFTRNQPPPKMTCYWVVRVRDNQFRSEYGTERTCKPSSG